jgi:hypothetical protein
LPTRFLGEFPDFLRNLTNVIRNANSHLIIQCDFPAYGRLSKPEDFRAYKTAIADKLYEKRNNKDFQLDFVCLSSKERKRAFNNQFPEKKWDEWKRVPTNLERLKDFLAEYPTSSGATADTISHTEFTTLLAQCNDRLLENIEIFKHPRVHLTETSLDMGVYFWIRDDLEAIFTYPSFEHEETEFGFFTADSRLIGAFRDISNKYSSRDASGRTEQTAQAID